VKVGGFLDNVQLQVPAMETVFGIHERFNSYDLNLNVNQTEGQAFARLSTRIVWFVSDYDLFVDRSIFTLVIGGYRLGHFACSRSE
jgi:hypothetical protein